jgi:DNA repair protein RecN (Recombination protein N)
MLTLLKIKNIALIDSLEVEFGAGLNLLTGETGSGKSIIVDSLGALTGERVTSDLIKEGEQTATIEGLFVLPSQANIAPIFEEAGIELEDGELIVRRELSLAGKNRVFVNGQSVTQTFLKRIGADLVDVHGQGEQASLFDANAHLEMLDAFADVGEERAQTADAYRTWSSTRKELNDLRRDESDKLQLVDILKFQTDEIRRAGLKDGEEVELEEEKRRLNNVEKLSSLSGDAYELLYEQDESTLATLEKAARKIDELADYDNRFSEYREPIATARAVIEDLATTARDFRGSVEFSPARLEEIENRLAEIARVTRKYGGSIGTALEHLAESEKRLENIESAEFKERELERKLEADRAIYLEAATALHEKRVSAAGKFSKEVEANLKAVALEKAIFQVKVDPREVEVDGDSSDSADPKSKIQNPKSEAFTPRGSDRVEFFFSANPGESPKPLAKVASGGEASRLMLILKTTAKSRDPERATVFDEIDAGIGGRVAEAVGLKLKQLARVQQVLCVTHQPQVAALADNHFVVEKSMGRSKTSVVIRRLNEADRIEEIARMLAGKDVTDSARTHAAEMLETAKRSTAETQRRRGAKG